MRAAFPFLVLAFAAACGDTNRVNSEDARWEYQPERGAVEMRLSYKFEDGERTELVGHCTGEPDFWLQGGNYELSAAKFLLTVDDRSWTLPAWQSMEGRALIVDRYEPNLAIANAKHRIVFEVGNWRREVKPGPTLRAFLDACG